jgi:hypothetical protein
MKRIIILLILVVAVALIGMPGKASSQNKYVGIKTCAPCHKMEKTGNQFGVWEKTPHAQAFKVLSDPKAVAVAKKLGLKKSAAESPECLSCHVITSDAVDKTFDMKDGVQCEVCHGPGSAYKTMAVMKDKAKAIAAGLTDFKDPAAIEAKCKTCHNEKSPTFKEFNFKASWDKIKHPLKKS